MARIGTIAAAPFLGSQFVSLYLGDERAPTVPGRPVVAEVIEFADIEFTPPADGGSAILGYNVYVADNLANESDLVTETSPGITPLIAGSPGDDVQIAAVNAIGEGPKSDPVPITAAP